MQEKATMVRSKAMMTQRGSILRLRMVFVSTGYGFFDFLFKPRIRLTPKAAPMPIRISMPVIGTDPPGSPPPPGGSSPGCASQNTEMQQNTIMNRAVYFRLRIRLFKSSLLIFYHSLQKYLPMSITLNHIDTG